MSTDNLHEPVSSELDHSLTHDEEETSVFTFDEGFFL
jgi:hypothetical protein